MEEDSSEESVAIRRSGNPGHIMNANSRGRGHWNVEKERNMHGREEGIGDYPLAKSSEPLEPGIRKRGKKELVGKTALHPSLGNAERTWLAANAKNACNFLGNVFAQLPIPDHDLMSDSWPSAEQSSDRELLHWPRISFWLRFQAPRIWQDSGYAELTAAANNK